MGAQFGRTCTLTLGTTQIKLSQIQNAQNPQQAIDAGGGLAIVFRVKKNLKPEPNGTELKVWNLAPTTRQNLQQAKTIPVQLDVGYGGDNHTIYLGQLRNAASEIDGPNIITSVSSGDSEAAFSSQRMNVKIPAQASAQQIFQLAGQAVGVGLGNLTQAQSAAGMTTGGPARTLYGAASKIFGDVARSSALQWSVQDGAMQVLPIGVTIKSSMSAVVLSASSGMIGSPTIDNKGIVKVEALIQPGLTPGLPIVIKGVSMQGTFRIEDTEFNGATWGKPWTATLHCRKWN